MATDSPKASPLAINLYECSTLTTFEPSATAGPHELEESGLGFRPRMSWKKQPSTMGCR
jgi:hypothetical protein